jgi:hypothetical protein
MARRGSKTGGDESGGASNLSIDERVTLESADGTGVITESDDNGIDESGSAESNSNSAINPESLKTSSSGDSGDSGSTTGAGKRRGRKPGSKNGSKRANQKETSSVLAGLLFSLHTMASSFLKIPELEITSDEAERLGSAAARVADLYDVSVLSETTVAWINLAMVAGGIYGPRFMAAKINKKNNVQRIAIVQ